MTERKPNSLPQFSDEEKKDIENTVLETLASNQVDETSIETMIKNLVLKYNNNPLLPIEEALRKANSNIYLFAEKFEDLPDKDNYEVTLSIPFDTTKYEYYLFINVKDDEEMQMLTTTPQQPLDENLANTGFLVPLEGTRLARERNNLNN